jgi:hypothetical protein
MNGPGSDLNGKEEFVEHYYTFIRALCAVPHLYPYDHSSSAYAGVRGLVPPIHTLSFRSTRHYSVAMASQFLPLCVFLQHPHRLLLRPAGLGEIMPSNHTLFCRSTRNQRANCNPIFPGVATVHLYRILQLNVFVLCPYARRYRGPVVAGFQGTLPSTRTLSFSSTRNQRGDCGPILASVQLHRVPQLAVFIFCPWHTRTSSRQRVIGIQGNIMPFLLTLNSRSTRNQRGDCGPILDVLEAILLLAGICN